MRKYLGLLLVVGSLCSFHHTAQAESDYELGVRAYQNKQFQQARNYWEESAADGNLSASFNLGLLLTKGIGGPVDANRAVSLFRHTAEAGLAIGQHNLALAYYSGNGIVKDNEQARIWWERAARQGHTTAQFNLGALLWNGDGAYKDANEAVKWFRKASDAGNLQARTFLDTIMKQEAASSPLEPLDTPTADSNPVISALLEQAANAYQLQDFESAFLQWNEAAELGNAIAQYQLARLYREGWGAPQDLSRAYQYTERSAGQNLAQAQYRLALYYLEGEQIQKNDTLALYWMQSAADQGHIKAKDYLERLR